VRKNYRIIALHLKTALHSPLTIILNVDTIAASLDGSVAQADWLGPKVGGHLALVLYSSDESGELWQWLLAMPRLQHHKHCQSLSSLLFPLQHSQYNLRGRADLFVSTTVNFGVKIIPLLLICRAFLPLFRSAQHSKVVQPP